MQRGCRGDMKGGHEGRYTREACRGDVGGT